MRNPFKAIAISLLPNFRLSDLWAMEVPTPPNMTLFESGRVAEYFLLKALGIGPGDEVIIQAFTCVAVPNSIIWAGAKPIYVDIDESLNIDPKKLEKLINSKTKAVIWQSAFGNLGQMDKAREICKAKNILFIEDGAHSGKVIGDLGFLSFGRDKVVSGLFGGGATVVKSEELRAKIDKENLERRNLAWIAWQIWYLVVTYFVVQTYGFLGVGRVVHRLMKSFLPKVLTPEEKKGERPEKFYGPPPGVLAQWQRRESFNRHRKELADYYQKNIPGLYGPLRYSIFVDDPDGLRKFAARKNVFLGDWYDTVVAPKGVNLEVVGYKTCSCSKAEEVCKKIVNLPTNPNLTLDDAKKVVEIIKLWKK